MKEYLVPSDRTTEKYTVSVSDDGMSKCTCADFRNRQRVCKHIQRVLDDPSKFNQVLPQGRTSTAALPKLESKPLPMLAKPFTDKYKVTPGRFAVEEKFDGHRMVVRVSKGSSDVNLVEAWSRTGKECKAKMAPGMLTTLREFPVGVYDGELVNRSSQHSYGVSHLQASKLTFVVFDLLELSNVNATTSPYDERRKALEGLFNAYTETPQVEIAPAWNIDTHADLEEKIAEVWDRHGEGVIVKRRDGLYSPGKRTDAFLKIKDVQIATVTIIGFCQSDGEINNRGLYATTVVEDAEGNSTVVKTLDDETLARLEKVAPISRVMETHRLNNGRKVEMCTNHPWCGKRLLIEYHERTPDGSYRHPRWDRLEDE